MTKAKKSIAFITAMAVVCLAFGLFVWQANKPSGESALAASAEQILTLQIGNPQMTVDGESVNIDDGGTTPVIIDDRTLLPVRAVVEAVGGTVEWDGDTRTTTLTYKNDVIKLTIDSTTAYLNDAEQTLDVTPVIINDRTMLPIRFIAESFKFTVEWDGDTQTVTITVPADAAAPEATAAPNTNAVAKSVVVYFSATNTTEGVAQKIADYTGADLFELEPKEPYTDDDLDWTDDNSRVVKEHNDLDNTDVELVTTDVPNFDTYSVIYIGAPIWWQEFSWVIDEFVENTDFTGKTVVPFCTSMSSGLGDSAKHLAEKTTTGTWIDGMRFGSSADDADIREWIDGLDLPTSGGTGTTAAASTVYMTTEITPEALVEIYDKLGFEPEGNVAVKMSTGEPPNSNYLRPELIGDLVKKVDGTIVECNTAYGGSRSETEMHKQVIEDHGLNAISKDGKADIMDEDGSMTIPVPALASGTSTITEDYVGAHLENYDSLISLAHFKGHAMAGYGGAIKNMSIGIGSQEGKCLIHTGGQSHDSPWGGDQDKFLESMGDATSAVVDYMENKVVYINVMNRLSVDCDCDGNPSEPDMHDIGILASYDPVAVDQACIDLIYAQKDDDGASLVNRIESRNGLHTLEHAAEIGLGSREYNLVSIDS